MKTKIFDFYADPGHGWLKVPKSLLVDLGITGKISSHSYQRRDYIYLEEDGDLSLFIKAMRESGVEVRFREHHTNKQSKIRSYSPFFIY